MNLFKNKSIITLLILLAVIPLVAFYVFRQVKLSEFQSEPKAKTVLNSNVNVAYEPGIENFLLDFSKEKYSNSNGNSEYSITLHESSSDSESLKLLLEKKVDYASISDYQFVKNIKEVPSLRILTVVNQYPKYKFISLKNTDFRNINELKDKKIGYINNSECEFNLINYLKYNNIHPDAGNLIPMDFARMETALLNKSVDAFFVSQRYLISKKLNNEYTVLNISVYPTNYQILVTTSTFVDHNTTNVVNLFTVLDSSLLAIDDDINYSEGIFISKNEIINNQYYSFDPFDTTFGVPQSLMGDLEEISNWIYKEDIGTNYLDYIDIEILSNTHPNRVSAFITN